MVRYSISNNEEDWKPFHIHPSFCSWHFTKVCYFYWSH